MAVVKINFVKKNERERNGAKAHIKYIQHRKGKDGAPITRTLFGVGGEMNRREAYDMIDHAEEGSTFFRIAISPDPHKEDTYADLLFREIAAKTMALEEHIGVPVAWVAAIHADHTSIRHIHVLAIAQTQLLPAKRMIQAATQACGDQRQVLDARRERQSTKEREEEPTWERERSK